MSAGDGRAAEELLSLVYAELRRIAAVKMAGEASGHMLQPTPLVHEAWINLAGNRTQRFDNRARIFFRARRRQCAGYWSSRAAVNKVSSAANDRGSRLEPYFNI
jgi:hypothetical protein